MINNESLKKMALESNIKLLFGNNERLSEKYRKLFKKLCNVKIISGQVETSNGLAEGACKVDKNKTVDGYATYSIEMLGMVNGLPLSERNFRIHEAIHEHYHSAANLLTLIYSKHNEGIVDKKILKNTEYGLIGTRNPETKEKIERWHYFKMFNETMMDILTVISKNSFVDKKYNADSILAGDDLGTPTSYTPMVPLTLLFIAAFSNNGNPEYSKKIYEGKGILFDNTVTSSNKKLKTNSFITNSLCDQILIEKEFEKYTSKGSFKKICYNIDKFYFTGKLDKIAIKSAMKLLSKFMANKLNSYLANNIFNNDEAYAVLNNFNNMFAKTIRYYDIRFNMIDTIEMAHNTVKFNKLTNNKKVKKKEN